MLLNVNDKIEGEYKVYLANGQLYMIESYIDGNRNGEYKFY